MWAYVARLVMLEVADSELAIEVIVVLLRHLVLPGQVFLVLISQEP